MAEPLFTRDADDDLTDIARSMTRFSRAAAERLIRDIQERAGLYAEHPDMGIPLPDLAPRLRAFVVRRYVVYYRPVPGTILILRVLHSSRDARRIMRRYAR